MYVYYHKGISKSTFICIPGIILHKISPNGKGGIKNEKTKDFTYSRGAASADYFGYKAVDAEGNVSQEATVIIRIEKQKKDVCYEDMNGRAEEYAAVALSENNIFTAEMIGGEYCFGPDKTVSRGEFLSMCMLTAGEP